MPNVNIAGIRRRRSMVTPASAWLRQVFRHGLRDEAILRAHAIGATTSSDTGSTAIARAGQRPRSFVVHRKGRSSTTERATPRQKAASTSRRRSALLVRFSFARSSLRHMYQTFIHQFLEKAQKIVGDLSGVAGEFLCNSLADLAHSHRAFQKLPNPPTNFVEFNIIVAQRVENDETVIKRATHQAIGSDDY